MKVLIDAKTLRNDGIGRFTRNLIFFYVKLFSKSDTISLNISTKDKDQFNDVDCIIDDSEHYSVAEISNKEKAVSYINPDVFIFSDYRSVFHKVLNTKYVTPIHDIFRFTNPSLCYENNYFIQKYGQDKFKDIIEMNNHSYGKIEVKLITHEQERYYKSSEHFKYYSNSIFNTCKLSDLLLTPTNQIKKELEFNIDPNLPIKVIPYGLNHYENTKVNNYSSINKMEQVVYVGQYRKHKNVDVLINLFKEIKELRDIKLLLVGSDFYSHNLNLMNSIRGIKNIVPLGFVEDRDLLQILSSSMALIQPSYVEGYGFTPLESFRLGVPVIYNYKNETLQETLGKEGIAINFEIKEEFLSAINLIRKMSNSDFKLLANKVKDITWENYVKQLRDSIYKL